MNTKIMLLRKKHKIKQQQLAKYLNITNSAYSKKERGNRQITINELKLLSAFYKISIEEFY